MALDWHYQARVHDPLRTFQFRVRFVDGPPAKHSYFLGVRSVSGLGWSIESHEIWEGGNQAHRHALPDRMTYEPVTLEHGLAMEDVVRTWAESAANLVTGRSFLTGDHRRTLRIEVWDGHLSENPRIAYTLYNAWVSKYQPLPKLDASASEVGIETLEITHEGFQRELFEFIP